MANITGAYWMFYIMGRGRNRLPERPEFEESELRKRMVDGGKSFRDTVRELCEPAIAPLRADRKRKTWLEENSEEIAEAGGDGDQAYAAYLDGVIDEMAKACDSDALESLESVVFEEDDDEEDDDEEDDDEEDDEDD